MRLSKQLFPERMNVPNNWKDMQTYQLFESCGWVEFPYSGFPIFLPIGKRIVNSLCEVIRKEAELQGFNEVSLPLIQKKEMLESTGRAAQFGKEFFTLSGEREGYILCPTNEEFFLNTALHGVHTYRQLPVKVFQIAEKFRDILKPKGILRSRQFLMCDMVSLDADAPSLYRSAGDFEKVVSQVFQRIGLNTFRIEKDQGKYADYVVPCAEGETLITIQSEKSAHYSIPGEENKVNASSVAMYFIFEDKGQLKLPEYQDPSGSLQAVFLGTYGFGIQRCFHAVVEQHRDDLGINFPAVVRPFDVSIILMDPSNSEHNEMGEKVYQTLLRSGLNAVVDDRQNKNLKEKARWSDFYGIPRKIILGRKEMQEGNLTLKARGNGSIEMIGIDHLEDYFTKPYSTH